jgi:hypothetical protein
MISFHIPHESISDTVRPSEEKKSQPTIMEKKKSMHETRKFEKAKI